jgi:LPS O-antigen subunit length determinant protein (WzzB/FepE family)
MNFKKKEIDDDQIDVAELIKTLWKDKILIVIICLIFTICSYLYGSSQSVLIKKNITLKDAEESLFHDIRLIQNNLILSNSDINIFNKIFKSNLMSLDKLILFTEKNNEIDNFKSHIRKKNISFEEYFNKKLNIEISQLDYELKYSNTST